MHVNVALAWVVSHPGIVNLQQAMFRREGSTNLNAFKTRLVEQEKKMEIYRPVDLPQQ